MNPRLVLCLFLAVAAALGSGAGAYAAGYGIGAALLAYVLVGSVALVGFSFAAVVLEDLLVAQRSRPAPKHHLRPGARPRPSHSA